MPWLLLEVLFVAKVATNTGSILCLAKVLAEAAGGGLLIGT